MCAATAPSSASTCSGSWGSSPTGAAEADSPLLRLTPEQLRTAKRFKLTNLAEPLARVEVWEEFRPGWLCVIGADTAFGIPGRDYDAAIVLCKHPGPIRQVAEIHGHFGDRFDRILYAACRYFGDAFLLVERQTLGLAILQRLYDQYQYRWLYYERRQETKGRRHTDYLGHPASANDLVLWEFRRAVLDGSVLLRSRTLLDQMGRLQFRESTPSPTGDRRADADLKVHLAGGGSPDLVMAAAYAWHAATQVHHFERPKPAFEPGSLGDILGHGTTFEPDRTQSNSWVSRRR